MQDNERYHHEVIDSMNRYLELVKSQNNSQSNRGIVEGLVGGLVDLVSKLFG
jgi:hypothetical protein